MISLPSSWVLVQEVHTSLGLGLKIDNNNKTKSPVFEVPFWTP